MLWKCCTQYASKFGKLSSGHRTGKEQVSFYLTTALISHGSKVMLKILEASLQQYMNQELPEVQARFSKARRTRDQNFQHPLDHRKSKRIPEKHIYFCFMDYQSLWLCGSQKNCGKFFKRWEYQATLPAFWENCMKVKKQQLEWDMEQWTGFKFGKEYVKAVYCHPAYLTYMQSTSC